MRTDPLTMNSEPARVRPRWLPLGLALAALAPLFWCWRDFRALFWFGDEWDQLDSISSWGFWKWMWNCFGENFAPAFKLTWGALALSSHGNYFFVVVAVWVAHAACVGLLARLLLRAGIGAIATAAAVLGFALAWTNIEALGWTIQLITIQGMLFFLAAALWQHARDSAGKWSTSSLLVLALLVVLGTFSFVRGALVGLSLAATALVAPLIERQTGRRAWATFALVLTCGVPALVSIGVIMKYAHGNHEHLSTIGFGAPAYYAASYYLLNPFYKFVTDSAWTVPVLLAYGAVKIAFLALGWAGASPAQRRMLFPLLVFDLANAALMGLGRFNEPLYTATSSRYQYISFVCTMPFIAVTIDWALGRVRSVSVRHACAAILLAAVVVIAANRWPAEMRGWSNDRGRETRRILFEEPHPPAEGAIPGIPFLRTSRAKELVQQYHLH